MGFRHAGTTLFAVVAMCLFAFLTLAADGDAQRGRKLAYTCMGCHGIENYKNAYPKYSVPKLGGQSAAYIAVALAEYRAGARPHPTMRGFAATLSAQDQADLAAFFQGPQRARPGPKPVGALPAAAAACSACHGQDGIGTLPENPTLAGQHADYLAQALNDYRLGRRQNPVMGTFTAQLTRDDIRALADYFAKQPGLSTPRL
ncbi:MAG TPA: c-type cytochrome [Steroidobacteraceae bacterium]|nr:c-type cytochrome [Steroidobacteraceae bacterium]